MQPKCSPANAVANTTSQSACLLQVPVERFKQACLMLDAESAACDHPKEVSYVLDYLFSPLNEFGLIRSDLEILKSYLTGGYSFDLFKSKSLNLILRNNYFNFVASYLHYCFSSNVRHKLGVWTCLECQLHSLSVSHMRFISVHVNMR